MGYDYNECYMCQGNNRCRNYADLCGECFQNSYWHYRVVDQDLSSEMLRRFSFCDGGICSNCKGPNAVITVPACADHKREPEPVKEE